MIGSSDDCERIMTESTADAVEQNSSNTIGGGGGGGFSVVFLLLAFDMMESKPNLNLDVSKIYIERLL